VRQAHVEASLAEEERREQSEGHHAEPAVLLRIALARTHRELVCGMNLAFMEGVLEGLGVSGIHATLDPQPGRCCVTLRPAP
jgi:hypothetical protein